MIKIDGFQVGWMELPNFEKYSTTFSKISLFHKKIQKIGGGGDFALPIPPSRAPLAN